MQCPVCIDEMLKMTERQGVEIDYCPRCRGVWLDRGELDKIIERANGTSRRPGPAEVMEEVRKKKNDDKYGHRPPMHKDRDRRDDRYDDRSYKKRRKKDFLEDLFDIFD